jgi:hypothetical protein
MPLTSSKHHSIVIIVPTKNVDIFFSLPTLRFQGLETSASFRTAPLFLLWQNAGMPSFETLQRGSAVLYGACENLWVMILFAKPTEPEMRLARPALTAMSERHRNGFPTLTWVLPSAGFSMDSAARRAATDVTETFKSSIASMATLIEGTGFQAAAVRAIIAGLDLTARAEKPRKVFGELAAAVAWSQGFAAAGERADAASLVTTLAAVRQSLDATAATQSG